MKLNDKFENNAGIYIIKNLINGKFYVGESLNISQRMCSHRGRKNQQMISKAIHKYGIDNFDVTVYYMPNFDKKSLISLEEQVIQKFNSLCPSGYNVCKKGIDNSGVKMTDASKKKMSQNSFLKGKRGASNPRSKPVFVYYRTGKLYKSYPSRLEASEDLNISKAHISSLCNKKFDNPNMIFENDYMGEEIEPAPLTKIKRYHTEESKKKMRENSPTRGKSYGDKKVYVYDLNGNYIKEFKSRTEAAKNFKISNSQISSVIIGRLEQSGGFIFKNEYLGHNIPKLKKKRLKPVAAYSKDMELIKIFNSISEGAKELKTFKGNIIKSCNNFGKLKAGGFYWKYYQDTSSMS